MSTIRDTFTTPFEQYADREGQPFEVLAKIETPDQDHDEEVLPMYQIRFPDGFETDAWPEEVETGWTVKALAQSYEDYLSDQPDQYGIPDGLTREQYAERQREAGIR